MAANVVQAFWNSARVTMRTLWRVTRELFHETTGALFAWFALYGAVGAWRQWKNRPSAWLIAFALSYSAIMIIFSVGAFRRARRVR